MALAKLALVVLGAHRSGTSAITQVLALSGFALPRNMLPAQPDNPSGFWESQVIVDLNDEILAMRDSSWHDAFPVDDGPLLSNSGAVSLARAESAISSEFQGASPIVLKDPRISVLTSFWKRALEHQNYASAFIIMVRNPVEVAASLTKRNGFSRERGLLLWLTHMIAAERKTRGERRLFVLYERLLTDASGIQDDIEAMTGEPLPRRTRAAGLEIQRAMNGELRHHRSVDPIMVRNELESLVKETYDWLVSSARNEALETNVLDQIAARLKACEEVAGGVMAELQSEGRELALTLQAELFSTRTLLLTEQEKSKRLDCDLECERSERLTILLASQANQAAFHIADTELKTELMKSVQLVQDLETARSDVFALSSAINIVEDKLLDVRAAHEAAHLKSEQLTSDLVNSARELTELRKHVADNKAQLLDFETALNDEKAKSAENARLLDESKSTEDGLHLALQFSKAELLAEHSKADKLSHALKLAEAEAATKASVNAHLLDEERRKSDSLALSLSEIRLALSAREKSWEQYNNELSSRARIEQTTMLEEWALERTELASLFQAQRGTAAEFRAQVDELSETLRYIQSRPWWRGLSLLKRLVR